MIKRTLRWLVRMIAIVIVLGVIMHVVDWWSHRVAPGSVLELALKGPVIERGTDGLRGLVNDNQTPLNVARRALRQAAADPHIVGLAVRITDPDMEFAQAQELIALIHVFKAHHKWTTAYLESAGDFGSGNLPYLVASAADEVSMMPEGEINLMGVRMQELFARGLFDKLGIRPNFAAIGKYKSAANIFTQKDFTPGQREEDEALAGGLFDQLVATAASERHLEPAQVRALIDQAPLSAQAGLKAHLIDRIEYGDQFTDRVKDYGGHDHAVIEYSNYRQVSLWPHFGHGDRLAVIYADGAIERGQGGFDPLLSPGGNGMGSDDMVEALDQARDDDSVRAVVLRINSPGGSVVASELIRRAAELLAKKKPLVVSMSGYAASGGYWIALPAAKIFAEPATITGSIGVLGGKFNIEPLLSSIGVNSAAISHGANATMFDAFGDFTPAQQQQFRDQILGETYQHFVDLVAHGRDLAPARVDQIAQGRVWTGTEAIKLKLVDGIGGLDKAIEAARKLAKVPEDTKLGLLELPAPPGLLSSLMKGKLGVAGAVGIGVPAQQLRVLLWMFDAAGGARGGWVRAVLCPVAPVI
ncbi:MAG TPA: signal peptide peptidase SppA [Candidatus Binataceae bacterium]|nr:signal peptide peptidase SppA [Candidatus Binataceae bacterium]